MKNKFIKKKGVTLIEIIISMAIISIMLIPILGIITNSVRTNANGESKQKATLAGQQVFENIKSQIASDGVIINTSTDTDKTIAGIKLEKDATGKYIAKTFKEDGSNYTFNGQNYKVEMTLEKDASLQDSASENNDYDAQYEVSGDSTNGMIKLARYSSNVSGMAGSTEQITNKTITITQSGDKKNINVDNSIVINSNRDTLNGKILIDFTKYKMLDSEMSKKFVIKINNESASDDMEIYIQQLNNQDIDVETELSSENKGLVKTYEKKIDASDLDGKTEPWNIGIKVFKAGSSEQLFSGNIIQDIKSIN